jgi:hypothetical protein
MPDVFPEPVRSAAQVLTVSAIVWTWSTPCTPSAGWEPSLRRIPGPDGGAPAGLHSPFADLGIPGGVSRATLFPTEDPGAPTRGPPPGGL